MNSRELLQLPPGTLLRDKGSGRLAIQGEVSISIHAELVSQGREVADYSASCFEITNVAHVFNDLNQRLNELFAVVENINQRMDVNDRIQRECR